MGKEWGRGGGVSGRPKDRGCPVVTPLESAAEIVQGQPAFSEFMRELDAHFAPASASETAELLLERANSFALSADRSLSALLQERLLTVDRAGMYSECGLYEYVRSALSEVVEGLPETTGLQGTCDRGGRAPCWPVPAPLPTVAWTRFHTQH
eukprot:scaffold7412_cov123-Isochrysis_galbana.AAC.13